MKPIDCKLEFRTDGKKKSVPGFENDWFSVEISENKVDGGVVSTAKLTAKRELQPISFEMTMETELLGLKYNANGYQSWSESPEVDYLYTKRNLSRIAEKGVRLQWYGDYHFIQSERKNRWMHSHLFLNLTEEGKTSLFLGDLMPYESYTWFTPDYDNSTVTATSDIEGLELKQGEEITLSRIIACRSSRTYLENLGIERTSPAKITGWTSWYNYYTDISADVLRKNIRALDKSGILMDIFQIDDGYFTGIGDWLNPNDDFPGGMKELADEIKNSGWTPGIWLAPFVCERESDIFKTKSHWIARDDRGRLQTAGWNPNWSGVFYALDMYNEEYREYMKEVFTTMKNEWGYGFFKLDFLYAACLRPVQGKTRAMVMSDGMDFLRELTKGALFLTCGVPIGPAMGKCDYCRIGADISHGFEDRFLKMIGYRERVSTFSAINNIKSRAFLDGYAFGNDPDVFILRNTGEIKMTEEEKELLFRTNMENSSLVFFSDDISKYDEDKRDKIGKEFAAYGK